MPTRSSLRDIAWGILLTVGGCVMIVGIFWVFMQAAQP